MIFKDREYPIDRKAVVEWRHQRRSLGSLTAAETAAFDRYRCAGRTRPATIRIGLTETITVAANDPGFAIPTTQTTAVTDERKHALKPTRHSVNDSLFEPAETAAFLRRSVDNGAMTSAIDQHALHRRLRATRDEQMFMHARVADELVARLPYLQLKPSVVLELGAQRGALTRRLRQHYPATTLIVAEPAGGLPAGLARRRWLRRPVVDRILDKAPLHANGLADDSIDLIVSNFATLRYTEPDTLLQEIARVLRPDGVFLFVTLGPESLRELRAGWPPDDTDRHTLDFIDMHDFGDALGRHGLREPVLDSEKLTLAYTDPSKLWQDLTDSGARNASGARRKGLMGRRRWAEFEQILTGGEDTFPITLELVYGHCFGGMPKPAAGDIRIAPGDIRVRSQ
ncbi:MAG: methyltransferase domain-containing protein [Pseudomonadota bacterium]